MLRIAQILFALHLKKTGTNEIVSVTNARYSCRYRSHFLHHCSGSPESLLPENRLHHPMTCGAYANSSPLCFTFTLLISRLRVIRITPAKNTVIKSNLHSTKHPQLRRLNTESSMEKSLPYFSLPKIKGLIAKNLS
jgi:hypothetical protein